MNHHGVIDHELRLYNQFKAEGKNLLHFCPDWDDMAIHSEMDEIAACCCDFSTEADNIRRDEISKKIEEKRSKFENQVWHKPETRVELNSTSQDFSSLGAPAHSGTDLGNRVAMMCMIVSNDAFKKEGWKKQVNDLLREMRDRILELEKKQ